jgi:hypothetical protein
VVWARTCSTPSTAAWACLAIASARTTITATIVATTITTMMPRTKPISQPVDRANTGLIGRVL